MSMRKIKEVLRLHFELGLRQREIGPGGTGVSRPSFSAGPKEAFGGAFKESLDEIVCDNHIHSLIKLRIPSARWPNCAPRNPSRFEK
jgi:hypothetical protein